MTKHFGFTLAEVLITLGIIGVVAAMTMPTLINQTRGAEFRAGFKKELSVMAQAAALNKALDDWDFSGVTGKDEQTLENLLNERINVIASGKTSSLTNYTVPTYTKKDDETFTDPAADSYATFNDGSMILFKEPTVETGCTEETPCYAFFDVNGTKGPNKITACDKADATKDNCYVKDGISDIFPVVFYDQTILPATNAGKAVLSDKTKSEDENNKAGAGAGAVPGGA